VDTLTQSVGRYRLIEKIGRGAMGEVYRAEDSGTGLLVALKVMASAFADDPELVERFRREALSASQLDHPNITRVHDFGEDGRQIYMAMELLEGEDLKELIEKGVSGGLEEKLAIMEQAGAGMAFVHARGLVHRDLKPGNIHVQPDGLVKIMDFGLVRVGDSNMTATGMVLGSPSYMSPEQIRGEKADARSDVFALGVVCYELLASRRAFGGKGLTQIMMSIINGEPEPLSTAAPEIPAPVAWIVERCLRKAPDRRYQDAGELHAALEVARLAYGPA
jgi:serine/threonine-protein kinase